jgi:hypothetical protein
MLRVMLGNKSLDESDILHTQLPGSVSEDNLIHVDPLSGNLHSKERLLTPAFCCRKFTFFLKAKMIQIKEYL